MRGLTIRPGLVAKAAGVTMAAGALAVAMSGSASATAFYTAYTSDSGATGGHTVYNSATAYMSVCDTQADGLRVWGSITWIDPDGDYVGSSWSDAGGNGTCASAYTPNLVRGVHFTITACLQDGPNGTLRYCKWVNGVE
jgi:hypothetical protein